MGIEFELKYSAEVGQTEAIRAAFPGDYQRFDMETTYYDTADAALSDRRITLRRRMENGVAVCTVKTPASGYGRGEWDCQCKDIHAAIPELCKRGAPAELAKLTAGGVAPVCGARFVRQAVTVEFSEAVLELALDEGVLLGGGRELPLCEVEVELKSGPAEAAVAFGGALARRFSLEAQPLSKFRRALLLAKGE